MSNIRTEVRPFFDLYSRGEVSAEQIGEFTSQWHAAPDSEQRSLAAWLGMTQDEYDVFLMDPDTLPVILAARRAGRSLVQVIADYVAQLRLADRPEDETALYALSHWLGRRVA
nr:hypothetical protein [uncultured Rhodopila sp.]